MQESSRRLPPLNAVKAFEASARHGSFSLAARELGVTPGAVSQQIRGFENFFGKQLFIRRNNQIQLTDAGMGVYSDCTEIIDLLLKMAHRLAASNTHPRFVISALPSIAVKWLNHALARYQLEEPDIRFEIRVEEDPVEFAHHHIDLRVCYGAHLYPELVTIPIIKDEVLPLCSPEFMARNKFHGGDPHSISDKDLIHVNWGASFASYPSWSAWFTEAHAPRSPQVELGHTAGMSCLAVDLAASGVGIALAQRLLARQELASGRLLAPFATSLPLGHPYCAVHPHSRSRNEKVSRFIAWLSRPES